MKIFKKTKTTTPPKTTVKLVSPPMIRKKRKYQKKKRRPQKRKRTPKPPKDMSLYDSKGRKIQVGNDDNNKEEVDKDDEDDTEDDVQTPKMIQLHEKDEEKRKHQGPYYVYALKGTLNSNEKIRRPPYYIGYAAWEGPAERLRAHNGLISKYGAKRTEIHRPWKLICYVTCSGEWFDTTEAMRLEWRWTKLNQATRQTIHLETSQKNFKSKSFKSSSQRHPHPNVSQGQCNVELPHLRKR